MKFELFYPQWKDRAVTFSYDDGQIFDRRLVDIYIKKCRFYKACRVIFNYSTVKLPPMNMYE